MLKKMFIGLAVSIAVICVLIVLTNRPIRAEGQIDNLEVLKRLDQVLADQKAILEGIEALKQEVYVIKIRVTQQQ